jgi:hypothetical protein
MWGVEGKLGKIVAYAILLSMLVYLPLTVYAVQGNAASKPQGLDKEKEFILDIAEKARIRAEIAIRLSLKLGIDTSTLNKTFNLGLELMRDATVEYERGNYSVALIYALRAMNTFRECIRNATMMMKVDEGNVSMGWMGLTVASIRLEEFIDRVNSSRRVFEERYNIDEAITVNAVNLLKDANDTLTMIRELLAEGNVSGAAKLLGEARVKANEALRILREAARSERIVSARMERYLRGIENAKSRIYEELKGYPQHVRERIRSKLGEVEGLLNEVRRMIMNRAMDRAMNRVMDVHRGFIEILEEMKKKD